MPFTKKEPMPKWIRNSLIAFCVIVLLIPVGGYIALNSVGIGPLKGKLVELASDVTGRQVEIDDLSIGFSLMPSVSVQGFRISNPEWAKEKWLADVSSASLKVDILKLLSGKVEIKSVTVNEASLNAEISPKGRHSWSFEADDDTSVSTKEKLKTSTTEDSRIVLEAANFDEMNVRFFDARNNMTQTARIDTLAVSGGEQWSIEGKGRYETLLLSLKYISGSSLLTSSKGDVSLKLTTAEGGILASAEGSVTDLKTNPTFAGMVSVEIDDAEGLKPWVKNYRSVPTPLKFASNAQATAERVRLDDAKITFMGMEGVAGLEILPTAEPMKISGSVKVDNAGAVVNAGGTTGSEGGASDVRADNKVIPDTKLDMSALKPVAFDISINIGSLPATETMTLQNVNAHLLTVGNTLTVSPVTASLADRTISGSLKVQQSASPTMTVELQGNDLPLAELVVADEIKSGRVSFSAALTGKGATVRQWAATSSGKVNMDISNAQIVTGSSGTVSAASMLLLGDKTAASNITVSCGAARWVVTDGVARPGVLSANSSVAYIEGKGEVNLGQEAINLTLIPYPRKSTLANLVVPVKLRGNFANPQVEPDKTAATKAVGSIASEFIGSKKVSGIVGALSKSRYAGGPQANPNNPCYTSDLVPAQEPEPEDVPAATDGAAPATPAEAEPKKLKEELKDNLKQGLQNFLKKN